MFPRLHQSRWRPGERMSAVKLPPKGGSHTSVCGVNYRPPSSIATARPSRADRMRHRHRHECPSSPRECRTPVSPVVEAVDQMAERKPRRRHERGLGLTLEHPVGRTRGEHGAARRAEPLIDDFSACRRPPAAPRCSALARALRGAAVIVHAASSVAMSPLAMVKVAIPSPRPADPCERDSASSHRRA